jgi:hypothetical protein
MNAFFRGLREAAKREVARRDFVPRTGDPNLGFVPIRIAHANGT